MATTKNDSKGLTRQEQVALEGLRLPALTLKRLSESGIYCVPRLSVALQKSTRRYLVRAHESGGAVVELGAYCGVVADTGSPLPWLQRIDTIGVNGLHSRAVAASLVRIHTVRVHHTYEMLITKHALSTVADGVRPTLVNSILFRGRQGTLEMDLWGKDTEFRGRVCPVFYDAGGDPLALPPQFEDALRNAVAAVTCCGCTHSHLLVPPQAPNTDVTHDEPHLQDVT